MILNSNLNNTWNTISLSLSPYRRKENFKPYTEPFRPLNEVEKSTITRKFAKNGNWRSYLSFGLISYQALPGGFTICNIIYDNKLYSGSSHCSKVDRWLPIRGKMLAFRRALESEGINLPTGEIVTNG